MEKLSVLLTLCERKPPVPVGFPSQRISDAAIWYFLYISPNSWTNIRVAGDLRHNDAHVISVKCMSMFSFQTLSMRKCCHEMHSGGRLNIKMLSYQYRDPHVKDKTVSRPSYLYHGNPHTWERQSLYWDGVQLLSRDICVQPLFEAHFLSTYS